MSDSINFLKEVVRRISFQYGDFIVDAFYDSFHDRIVIMLMTYENPMTSRILRYTVGELSAKDIAAQAVAEYKQQISI